MLRTFDIVLVGVMTATAALTYTIKHRAELKLEEVHRLEAEIKLEKDTIDLLRADWALLTQPNRLQRLADVYGSELQLQPTESTALVRPSELPMLRSQLPQSETAETKGEEGEALAAGGGAGVKIMPLPIPRGGEATDMISTGSVED